MRPEKCNACLESHFILVWSDYCALSNPGVGREESRAKRPGAEGGFWASVSVMGKKYPWNCVEDSLFIGRGEGRGYLYSRKIDLLDPCGGMLLVEARTWGCFICVLGRSRVWRRNLIRSYQKERKSNPGFFSGQISNSQSSKPRRCLSLWAATCTMASFPSGKAYLQGLWVPRQSTGAANLLRLSGGENPGFQACFESFLASGQPHSHSPRSQLKKRSPVDI